MHVLQRVRESLTLVLIGLLPLHALFVTVATKLIMGPSHAPLPMLAAWKEGLLAVILVTALIEFLRKPSFKIDWMDGLIGTLLIIALLLPTTNFLFGFKYDFIPLIAFLMLRRVRWSDQFRSHAEGVLLLVGGVIALYGIVTFFLPDEYFWALGYSDAHSLYIRNGSLASFQYISGSGIARIQSTMSGPNQLGIWLLIPLSVVVLKLVRRKVHWFVGTLVMGVIGIAMLMTFSRSAWIAAAVMAIVTFCTIYWHRRFTGVMFVVTGLCIFAVLITAWLLPAVFVRRMSLIGHIQRPLEAIQMIKHHPLGLGLGTAGPASNRISDTCVYLESNDDASWAKGNTNLCVFVGDKQVQPVDRPCRCPFLTENWYLQIGVELGVLGFVLYLGLIASVLYRLRKNTVVFLAFLGISIAGLFLHAWEDAAVAYTAWILLAATL